MNYSRSTVAAMTNDGMISTLDLFTLTYGRTLIENRK